VPEVGTAVPAKTPNLGDLKPFQRIRDWLALRQEIVPQRAQPAQIAPGRAIELFERRTVIDQPAQHLGALAR
jgi:hypothetical protein